MTQRPYGRKNGDCLEAFRGPSIMRARGAPWMLRFPISFISNKRLTEDEVQSRTMQDRASGRCGRPDVWMRKGGGCRLTSM